MYYLAQYREANLSSFLLAWHCCLLRAFSFLQPVTLTLTGFINGIMQHYSAVLVGQGYSQGIASITQDCRRPGAKSEMTARLSRWLSCSGVFQKSSQEAQ